MTEKHSPPADLKERLRAHAEQEGTGYLAKFDAALMRQAADRIVALEAQLAEARAFAESFHVTVIDNFYKDVTLHLDRPHSMAIRLQNDSSISWLFAELEARRRTILQPKATS